MRFVRSADGTSIGYESHGSGPPVVLVAGALCDRSANRPLAEELARRDRTGVTYDRRGRGASEDGGSPGVDREVEDLAAVVDDLGRPPAIYGHSSGAGLALRAVAAGVSATHLVLHEAPFNVDDPDAERVTQEYRRQLDRLLDDQRDEDAVELFLRTVGAPDDLVDEMRREPWWPGMVGLAPSLVHDSEAMGDRHGATVPSHLLAQVHAPTLVLHGDASPPWMLDVARQLVDGLPDASLEILAGQEHVVPADVLAPVLDRFLALPTELGSRR
jgi:pimeloyl-ACP methyl ester carboxylesterase